MHFLCVKNFFCDCEFDRENWNFFWFSVKLSFMFRSRNARIFVFVVAVIFSVASFDKNMSALRPPTFDGSTDFSQYLESAI